MEADDCSQVEEQALGEDPRLFIWCVFPSKGQKTQPSGEINVCRRRSQYAGRHRGKHLGSLKGR